MVWLITCHHEISIHALREESDHDGHSTVGGSTFQSTLSVRRATDVERLNDDDNAISIHALREESDLSPVVTSPDCPLISIHALREESDHVRLAERPADLISIHALREESDSENDGSYSDAN